MITCSARCALCLALVAAGGCNLEQRLFGAVEKEDLGEVKLLLAAGADVNAERPGRISVLHAAARHDRPDIVAALIVRGAAADRFDNYGCTPLHNAAAEGHRAVAELLIDSDWQVDACDRRGDRLTPLHCAAYHGGILLPYWRTRSIAHRSSPLLASRQVT